MQVSTLEKLVSIPSVSGNEHDIADYTAERCQAFGHAVTSLGDNVAVHIAGADTTKALILNGHTDTVPPTEHWDSDPFTLTNSSVNDDYMIGLGSSDMKAGIAMMLNYASETAVHRPPCDMWLVFSSKEETDSSGSVQIAEWLAEETAHRYRTIGGLILEPTNADFVGVGHRGSTLWNISAEGPGGHASQDFGSDLQPIERVGRLIAGLPEIRQILTGYTDDTLGTSTINVTTIMGGRTTNVVPQEAGMTLDLRVTPQLSDQLPNIRSAISERYGVDIVQLWQPNPTLCGQNEQIYRVAHNALPGIPFQAFPGATDQFAFHDQNIPMLIFGPGDISAMHQANEWVSRTAISRCKGLVDAIIREF
jgi:succinyl-diaminopimelate desuccinylase